MNNTIKALDTYYNGHKFRSRLEARWAIFFDAMGITWQYEPEGYRLSNGMLYLPDFYFPQVSSFAEVKPDVPNKSEMDKARFLCEGTKKDVIFLVGPPAIKDYCQFEYDTREKKAVYSENTYGGIAMETLYLGEKRFPFQWFGYGADPSDLYQIAVFNANSARF